MKQPWETGQGGPPVTASPPVLGPPCGAEAKKGAILYLIISLALNILFLGVAPDQVLFLAILLLGAFYGWTRPVSYGLVFVFLLLPLFHGFFCLSSGVASLKKAS